MDLLKSLPVMSLFGRSLLFVNGLALARTGAEYYNASSRETCPTLAGLFKDEVLDEGNEGGVFLLTPFLSAVYLTVSAR